MGLREFLARHSGAVAIALLALSVVGAAWLRRGRHAESGAAVVWTRRVLWSGALVTATFIAFEIWFGLTQAQ